MTPSSESHDQPPSPASDPLWVVMTTVPDRAVGLRLAHTLVYESQVVCAQLLPAMTSVYCWQGEVQTDSEHLLLLKTPASHYPLLQQRLLQLHPYTTPEILALPAVAVSSSYLSWALAQVL